MADDFCRFVGGLPAGGWPALRAVALPGLPSAAGLDVLAASAVTALGLGLEQVGFWAGGRLARFTARVADRVESLALDHPTARQAAAVLGGRWPRLRRLTLDGRPAGVVPVLARADLPALDHLCCDLVWFDREWESPPAGLGRTLAESPPVGRLTSLRLRGWPGRALDEFWPAFRGGRLRLLEVHGYGHPVRLPDLTRSPGLSGLRAARLDRVGFDLTELADPGVLPELHTLWVDDPATPPPRSEPRWRGGRRTVLTRTGCGVADWADVHNWASFDPW